MQFNDRQEKLKYKTYADATKRAQITDIKIQDLVLHIWPITTKFQPRFDPNPYKVIASNGTMLIAYREGERPLTRNVLFKTTETTTHSLTLD